jgi:tetratricopeptide (TPR) repeat protein
MFADSIRIDPGYALALAGIADCHSMLFMYFDSNPANLEKADAASRKALELTSDLAEAHVARGLVLSLKKDYAEAQREFQTAIRLDPTSYEARYFFGRTCKSAGKLVEAAQQFEQACRLRPDEYQAAMNLASTYAGMDRKADTQAAYQRAVAVAAKHLELHPDDARAFYLGATGWASLRESARALEWVGRALAIDPDDPVTLYNVACVYALHGEIDKAIDCLENALRHGFAHKEWIEHDTDLTSLRGHPRYQALLRGM